ncbi:MAG: glycosyltransferase family 4 protein [Xanthobacteraceae bacterium]
MPKILYLIAEDRFFVSHFLSMAAAAEDCNLDVAVAATRTGPHADRIAERKYAFIDLDMKRRSLGPFEALRNLRDMQAIIRRERPDIVHCIALRLVVLGGIAARRCGVRSIVLAPTGLGYLWEKNSIHRRVLRKLVQFVVGRWLRGPRTRYVFEHAEDARELGLDSKASDVFLVPGAGVDAAQFPLTQEPSAPPVKVAVVSRMLDSKGIAEAVEATRRARALGAPIELSLFGESDTADSRTIPEATLRQWAQEPGIKWHGHTPDVAKVWRDHHIALFLSYREGVPRTLLEAAASGRPIVTTDIPGCREVVRNSGEGVLVPIRDAERAAAALVRLASDRQLRIDLGAAAHRHFMQRFSASMVRDAVRAVYASALSEARARI